MPIVFDTLASNPHSFIRQCDAATDHRFIARLLPMKQRTSGRGVCLNIASNYMPAQESGHTRLTDFADVDFSVVLSRFQEIVVPLVLSTKFVPIKSEFEVRVLQALGRWCPPLPRGGRGCSRSPTMQREGPAVVRNTQTNERTSVRWRGESKGEVGGEGEDGGGVVKKGEDSDRSESKREGNEGVRANEKIEWEWFAKEKPATAFWHLEFVTGYLQEIHRVREVLSAGRAKTSKYLIDMSMLISRSRGWGGAVATWNTEGQYPGRGLSSQMRWRWIGVVRRNSSLRTDHSGLRNRATLGFSYLLGQVQAQAEITAQKLCVTSTGLPTSSRREDKDPHYRQKVGFMLQVYADVRDMIPERTDVRWRSESKEGSGAGDKRTRLRRSQSTEEGYGAERVQEKDFEVEGWQRQCAVRVVVASDVDSGGKDIYDQTVVTVGDARRLIISPAPRQKRRLAYGGRREFCDDKGDQGWNRNGGRGGNQSQPVTRRIHGGMEGDACVSAWGAQDGKARMTRVDTAQKIYSDSLPRLAPVFFAPPAHYTYHALLITEEYARPSTVFASRGDFHERKKQRIKTKTEEEIVSKRRTWTNTGGDVIWLVP
ncbi:hypothetical protein NEOLEDRAFT_1150448 [Neolentinus lepideus HHB14362 ss-1]|uniref:Uncharacterized protein n=1 Tax=Neolentinus lepideus HHB14362 ss-1 TaxID=1314782 RepID=A0A165Q3E6_9AGAM|nr:hypothetical protein NEOLEDRAFT_1150448 [Neolentinus lepideus HHB14362 ss-1]